MSVSPREELQGWTTPRPLRSPAAVRRDTGARGVPSAAGWATALAVGGERLGQAPSRRSPLGRPDAAVPRARPAKRNRARAREPNSSRPPQATFPGQHRNLGGTSLQNRSLTCLTILSVRTGLCTQPAGVRPLDGPWPGARPVLARRLFLRPAVPLSAWRSEGTAMPPRWSQGRLGGPGRGLRCEAEPRALRAQPRPPSSVASLVPVFIGPL